MKILLLILVTMLVFGGLIVNYFRSKLMKAFKGFDQQNFAQQNYSSSSNDDILYENNNTVISKGEAGKNKKNE